MRDVAPLDAGLLPGTRSIASETAVVDFVEASAEVRLGVSATCF